MLNEWVDFGTTETDCEYWRKIRLISLNTSKMLLNLES